MAAPTDQQTFLETEITKVEAEISQVHTAITALLGGAQSYQLSTGQTSTMVTKASLKHLKETYSFLFEQRQKLVAQWEAIAGCKPRVFNGRPAW